MPKKTTLLVLSIVFTISFSGCNSIAGVFATPTPTATNTPTSTPTPLPTITPTPAPTFTPTPEPVISQEQLPDGSVLYIDRELGYQLVLPPGWVVLDLVEEDISQIYDFAGEALPEIKEMIEEFGSITEQGVRAFIVGINEDSDVDGFSSISILYDGSTDLGSMSMEGFMEAVVVIVPEMIPSLKIIDWGASENPNGIEYGEMVSVIPQSGDLMPWPVKQRQVFIRIGEGLIIITFSSPESDFPAVEETFNLVLDSFEITED